MAIKQELRTFKQIQDQIMGLMKYQSTDAVSRERIKGDIQRAYLTEVMPYHEWPWLRSKVQVQADAYFATGTASVTQGAVTVTLTEVVLDTRAGYLFSVDGSNVSYRIKSHAPGSSTLVLDVPYTDQTNSAIKFKIWNDTIPLPSEVVELIEATHPFLIQPLTGVGIQELTRLAATGPKSEGRPFYCSLGDWVDPAPYSSVTGMPASASRSSNGLVRGIIFSGTLGSSASNLLLQVGDRISVTSAGSYHYNIEAIVSSVSTTNVPNDTITYTALSNFSEASTIDSGITVQKLNSEGYEKQRLLHIYPSIYNAKTTLTISYTKEAQPLVDDLDEPSIPLADRVILFWLGLSYAYSRERNEEQSIMYRTMAEARLARMAGNTNESTDKLSITLSKNYLNAKRNSVRPRRFGWDGVGSTFGGGSTTNPLGTPNQVAVFGSDGTLQSSMNVSTGELSSLDGIVGNIEDRLNALGLDSATTIGGRVLQTSTDPTPKIEESPILNGELLYLDDVQALTSITLVDDTSSPMDVVAFDLSTSTAIQIIYSIVRASAVESGMLNLISNGTSVAIAQGAAASLGDVGVSFSADIASGTIRLRYTTTSTGSNAALKIKAHKWLA